MKTYKIRMDSGQIHYVKTIRDEESLAKEINNCSFIRDLKGWLITTSKIESFIDVSRENEDV